MKKQKLKRPTYNDIVRIEAVDNASCGRESYYDIRAESTYNLVAYGRYIGSTRWYYLIESLFAVEMPFGDVPGMAHSVHRILKRHIVALRILGREKYELPVK